MNGRIVKRKKFDLKWTSSTVSSAVVIEKEHSKEMPGLEWFVKWFINAIIRTIHQQPLVTSCMFCSRGRRRKKRNKIVVRIVISVKCIGGAWHVHSWLNWTTHWTIRSIQFATVADRKKEVEVDKNTEFNCWHIDDTVRRQTFLSCVLLLCWLLR